MSINSREATSLRKWSPPFLKHVSVSYPRLRLAVLFSGTQSAPRDGHTLRALSWMFGFLCPMRFFRDLIASRGWTVFERMVSEISRLRAMSSLSRSVWELSSGQSGAGTYRLLLVAFSICSSKAVLAEEDHQLIILPSGVAEPLGGGCRDGVRRGRRGGRGTASRGARQSWCSDGLQRPYGKYLRDGACCPGYVVLG